MAEKAFFGLVSSGLLVAWFYGPWQNYCVDYFRQYTFVRRDRLFDLMRTSGDGLISAEYRAVRAQLEANIRFAHKSTFLRVITLWIFSKELRTVKNVDVDKAIMKISDPKIRDQFDLILSEIRMQMMFTMIKRSGLLLAIVIVILPIVIPALVVFALARRAGAGAADKAEMAFRESYSRNAKRIVVTAEIEAQCA